MKYFLGLVILDQRLAQRYDTLVQGMFVLSPFFLARNMIMLLRIISGVLEELSSCVRRSW
jgi:hypothetical protein